MSITRRNLLQRSLTLAVGTAVPGITPEGAARPVFQGVDLADGPDFTGTYMLPHSLHLQLMELLEQASPVRAVVQKGRRHGRGKP